MIVTLNIFIRLLEDIANYESIIEQLNNDKKKMNVKVHAADTYLTQVKELESAYRLDLKWRYSAAPTVNLFFVSVQLYYKQW